MDINITNNKKRQWGAEKNTAPLPILHNMPKTSKIAFSRIAIVLTILFWVVYIFSIIIRQLIDGPGNYSFTMEAFSYSFVVSMLTFSSLMYLVARHGALQRFAKHSRVPRAIIDKYFSKKQPKITVLVPSYNEEYQVVRKTILSAILQEYPGLRIVLLLDDKPNPTNTNDASRLEKTRALSGDIKKLLSTPYNRVFYAFKQFQKNNPGTKNASATEISALASEFRWAAGWLKTMANNEPLEDHVDVFFVEQVLGKLAEDLKLTGEALEASVSQRNRGVSRERIGQLYQRLVWIFQGEVEIFERKKFASLSHEANKAMNLNAYISLMGGTYRKVASPDGDILIPTSRKSPGNITVPNSDYLLTLDADSILLREYCLRLVYFLEQPENERVAVTQTPYSSFRGAYSRIERLAGATTDIQHILHQGMSYYGATFWVGANAVIRKAALEDIAETDQERGYEIKRYIQDRTVIEDTESSIDLGLHGWKLMNYPERLSYSATPPDFGSLVVQRRRWANGGLIIMSKFLSHIRTRRHKNELISRAEIMLRINYMASIAWATFGLIFLLAYPYDGRLLSPLVLLAAAPYFMSMASDLKYCRYKYSDIIRIYGFNLIMLPVNLAGVAKSIEQAITGKKIPFARTPKVKNRTATSLVYVAVPPMIVAFSLFTVARNIESQNWGNALFAGFNAFAASWAIVAYIGIKNMLVDIWLGLTNWLYVQEKPKALTEKKTQTSALDWQAVLYHGETSTGQPKMSLGSQN